MPKFKTWNCRMCGKPVSELGAYVKLNMTVSVHVSCFGDDAFERGRLQGRQDVSDDQRRALELQQKADEANREYAKALEERKVEIAERERTNRIRAAQAMPLPPIMNRPTPAPEVKRPEPKEPKDRFGVIEID